ncbi:MAG: cobyric acid synthase [Desulfobacterales bacterium]|jgi:adenosylcobyric acid synthase|nr:cobyric acid synthase [Desulfobacterales bacterium]
MSLECGDQKKAACLAVLGTGSDVGKSVICAALCRIFAQKGVRVAPFKAQNMSNNSGVTPDGLEMGRAQIVQAEAAGMAPHVDMNPILLKPTSDRRSQLVLMGKVVDTHSAAEYYHHKETLFHTACEALDRLRNQYDLVVMEGAGSCAEVNLMDRDIVNLKMATYADAPVILAADIHRGGVFAQIIGTLACLSDHQRHRIAGFIINRFRGDSSLFSDGVSWIEEKTGKPVFGVLPWFHHFRIENEDSVAIEAPPALRPERINPPAVAVIRIPHISNFTDFDPLTAVDGLHVYYLERPQDLNAFSGVILPGSKSTCHDLKWLHRTGWQDLITTYASRGGHVLGVCGGYQMLGEIVHDPDGIEGKPGSTTGLCLLPIETVLSEPKTTSRTRFSWNGIEGLGYEIHMGKTDVNGGTALFLITEKNGLETHETDGCVAATGNIMGTYIHGLFDSPGIIRAWLQEIGVNGLTPPPIQGACVREENYEKLATHFKTHVDMDRIMQMLPEG